MLKQRICAQANNLKNISYKYCRHRVIFNMLSSLKWSRKKHKNDMNKKSQKNT